MAKNDKFIEQLDLCISSSSGFNTNSQGILSSLQQGNRSYWNIYFQKLSSTITRKHSPFVNRFCALYLLFRSTETCSLDFAARLCEEHELLTFLFLSAMTESTKPSEQRGKCFFSFSPSAIESRIGNKFVRLCLECFILWQRNFGKQDKKHPCYEFNTYCDSIRKKLKFPSHYYFIGRDYDIATDLTQNILPSSGLTSKVNSPKNIETKVGIQNHEIAKESQTNPSKQVLPLNLGNQKPEKNSAEDRLLEDIASNQGEVLPVFPQSNILEKDQPEMSFSHIIKAEIKPDSRTELNRLETEDKTDKSDKNIYKAKSKSEPDLINNKGRNAEFTAVLSSVDLSRSKNYKEKITIELKEIHDSIEKSRAIQSCTSSQAKTFQFSKTANTSPLQSSISPTSANSFTSKTRTFLQNIKKPENHASPKSSIVWTDGNLNTILNVKRENEQAHIIKRVDRNITNEITAMFLDNHISPIKENSRLSGTRSSTAIIKFGLETKKL